MVFNDNKKNSSAGKIVEVTKVDLNIDQPVEDLVNAPSDLKEKSLEINTNKGKLVVTTSVQGTELTNVVLEKKSDKKETETTKTDDVDDPAKKARVSAIFRLLKRGLKSLGLS